ncbi:MAG: NADP-dependent oxidoreductase, partial [Oxalobacteraceae bacterium]
HTFGGPENLVYEDVPAPKPGPGEVVVAVAAAGVNPADYKFRNGMLAVAVPGLPFVPGMDIAGRVVALGDGVSSWKVGDRVMALLQLMGNGAYQEQVAVPVEWCAPTPDQLDDVTAAALPTPAITAFQLIEEGLKVGPGVRLLVVGAVGAVGRIACFAAQAQGAHVTAAVRRSQMADVVYADASIALEDDFQATGHFDAIADTVGGATATRFLPSLKAGGMLKTVATDPVLNPDNCDVAIEFFSNYTNAAVLERAALAVASGELSIIPPTVMPLRQASNAHAALERGGAGKIVLTTE